MAERFFELDKNSFSRYLGRGLYLLCEISHPDFDRTFYLVNNTVNVTVEGQEYEAYPFDLVLPSQTEQDGTKITLSNIYNLISNELRKIITSNVSIAINIFIANIEDNAADKIDKGGFELIDVAVTNEAVSGSVNIRNCLNINLGSMRFNKQLFPNLFL